ncbi:MAG: hypothetical protein FJZ04_03640 [Candidatus Moranbacteria bacterium]|nr:hypothetical protein [Candidatus Moranbacteria bacterium]
MWQKSARFVLKWSVVTIIAGLILLGLSYFIVGPMNLTHPTTVEMIGFFCVVGGISNALIILLLIGFWKLAKWDIP